MNSSRRAEVARLRALGAPIPASLFAPTPREAEVIAEILRGKNSQQIADDLWITLKTLEAHRGNIRWAIRELFGVDSGVRTLHIILYGLRYGLIPEDSQLYAELKAYGKYQLTPEAEIF